jgi:hypothetical protein
MEPNKCISEASAALGRELTDDEAISLFTEVQKRIKAAKATSGPFDEAIQRAGEDYAKERSKAARIEKRNAAISVKLRMEVIDFIRTQFPNDYAAGLDAFLVGSNKVGDGTRDSVAARQVSATKNYLRGFITDLEKAQVLKLLTNKQSDREIANALWSIENPAVSAYTGPAQIKKVADIIHKWQEVIRIHYNNAGANINKLVGYIVRQSHDTVKIRAAGKDKWIADIEPRLDFTKTFEPGDDAKAILGKIYESFLSGIHLKASENITGFKGGTANLAKKASAERVLHFKDANSWYDYHSDYGVGSISDAIIRQMHVAGQNIEMMRSMGPNPRDNYNRIVEYLRKSVPTEQAAAFNKATGKKGYLENRLAEIDGSTRIPGDNILAQISLWARFIQTISKMGGSVLASFTDIPSIATELRYQGFDMTESFGQVFSGLLQGQRREDYADIYEGLGITADSLIGALSSKTESPDNMPGMMSSILQAYFKLNGLTWWTDTLRATAVRTMSFFAARNKNLSFDQLNPDTSRVYRTFGIDAEKWDMFRQTATKAVDGKEYLLPNEIKNLPDDVFVAYLEKRNIKATKTSIEELKYEVTSQWLTYFDDRASYAVLEPDAKTKAFMNQGHAEDTPVGASLRVLLQFKAFPIAFVQKTLGREIYGRGADPSAGLFAALKNGNGEAMGLAQVLIWSTLFGYLSLTAKDLAKGKTPRKPETAEEYKDLILASMAQGGGAGIFGDFIFGDMRNRYGSGPVSSILFGPTGGSLDSIADLYGRFKKGDETAAAAAKFIINHTPGANIFYTRAMLDYLVTYRIQEGLNPGYLKRMEKKAKEQKQTFFLPPSQVIQ